MRTRIIEQRASDYIDLQTATGKTWREWFTLLDMWQGESNHVIPAMRYLVEQQAMEPIWAAIVALHYCWKRLQEMEHE